MAIGHSCSLIFLLFRRRRAKEERGHSPTPSPTDETTEMESGAPTAAREALGKVLSQPSFIAKHFALFLSACSCNIEFISFPYEVQKSIRPASFVRTRVDQSDDVKRNSKFHRATKTCFAHTHGWLRCMLLFAHKKDTISKSYYYYYISSPTRSNHEALYYLCHSLWCRRRGCYRRRLCRGELIHCCCMSCVCLICRWMCRWIWMCSRDRVMPLIMQGAADGKFVLVISSTSSLVFPLQPHSLNHTLFLSIYTDAWRSSSPPPVCNFLYATVSQGKPSQRGRLFCQQRCHTPL